MPTAADELSRLRDSANKLFDEIDLQADYIKSHPADMGAYRTWAELCELRWQALETIRQIEHRRRIQCSTWNTF